MSERIANAIMRGIAEWNAKCVEPTHIVIGRETLATLADEQAVNGYAYQPLTLWGFPVIVADIGGWAIGTDRERTG